jgi:hypothetical protein
VQWRAPAPPDRSPASGKVYAGPPARRKAEAEACPLGNVSADARDNEARAS